MQKPSIFRTQSTQFSKPAFLRSVKIKKISIGFTLFVALRVFIFHSYTVFILLKVNLNQN